MERLGVYVDGVPGAAAKALACTVARATEQSCRVRRIHDIAGRKRSWAGDRAAPGGRRADLTLRRSSRTARWRSSPFLIIGTHQVEGIVRFSLGDVEERGAGGAHLKSLAIRFGGNDPAVHFSHSGR